LPEGFFLAGEHPGKKYRQDEREVNGFGGKF